MYGYTNGQISPADFKPLLLVLRIYITQSDYKPVLMISNRTRTYSILWVSRLRC